MSLSELVTRSIMQTKSDAIIAADRNGLIQVWNPGAERMFGHSQAEAVGRSLDLIIPERLRGRHWDGYRKTMATGISRYGEGDVLAVPALHKSGRTISVEFTVVPLKDEDGSMVGMAAIMRDVTKRFDEMRALRRQLAQAAKPLG